MIIILFNRYSPVSYFPPYTTHVSYERLWKDYAWNLISGPTPPYQTFPKGSFLLGFSSCLVSFPD